MPFINQGADMFSQIITEIMENLAVTLADYGQCKG
jgi:hypothetical protein